jgi:elongation factor P
MASLIEAIEVKRKIYFEVAAPRRVEISRPPRGTRCSSAKMRNLVTRPSSTNVQGRREFDDPTFMVEASYLYADSAVNFMDQESFETLTLRPELLGDDRLLLVDNLIVQVQKFNGNPIGVQFPPHVEMTVTATESGVRGNTASGSVTKNATLESGLQIQVPLFIKEGERVRVHTETREFSGRA